jgi:hypothetical protein
MNSNDDLFDDNFLKNETTDDDNEKEDDEFYDALTESHHIKRKNEYLNVTKFLLK